MCEKRCYLTTADRKDFCSEGADGTRDGFEDQFFDQATRAIESLTADELAEIERDFRQHYAGFQFHGLTGARA